MAEKSVWWRTNLDAVALTLGAGHGLVADAALAAGAAGVHEAIPAPDLAQGLAASTPDPDLVANTAPGPDLGESLIPNPSLRSQSLVLARVQRSPALAPGVAPKQSPRGIQEAAPGRNQPAGSPEADPLLRERMETERGSNPLPVRRPQKKIGVIQNRPANVLRLALVPVLDLLLKTNEGISLTLYTVRLC